MKLNNKGFALTSIIYMLIVLFLMVMLLILANLAQRKVVLDKIKSEVKENLNQGGLIAKNTYTVTFDPTIGQINQTTKQVTYGEPYGELPTPTREGYEFAGWRGKNMFNPNNVEFGYIDDADGVLKTPNNYVRHSSKYIEIKSDTDYTISPLISSGKWGAFYDEDKNFIIGFKYINGLVHSPTNAKYLRFTINYQNSNENYATTTQLEEGNTATPYEPYQEYTSNTLVTKQENHTLYAMWKPKYTVTFDPNGGTLEETTKQVIYEDLYGELPTPTREGYTFLGWNGSNLFDKDKNIEDTYVASDGTYTLSSTGSKTIKLPCKPNTKYYIKKEESTRLRYGFYNEEPKENVKATYVNDQSSTTKASFTTSNDTSYIAIFIINGPDTTPEKTNSVLNSVMINEGTSTAEYEPYYITSDTTVVQTQNHTLTAIWQANE